MSSLYSAVLRDDTPQPDTISLGDGYFIEKRHLIEEARLVRALRAVRANAQPISFPPDFLNDKKNSFIQAAKKDEIVEQANAVFDELAKPEAVSIVTGPPGAAKTTVATLFVNMARDLIKTISIVLVAQEKPALHRLQEKLRLRDAAIMTIDDVLNEKTAFPNEACIILDEASLCGTHVMATILEKAAAATARKIILIGDDKQLFPDDVGQPFRWLRENNKVQTVTLTHSFRQKTEELRTMVTALHEGDVATALDLAVIAFVAQDDLIRHIRRYMENKAPEKTLVIVHGPQMLLDRFNVLCPGFRFYSLAASQGLAIDEVTLIIAEPINLSELLVGCSRQRFKLDVFVDKAVYADEDALKKALGTYPKSLMALDLLSEDTLLTLADQIKGN